MAATKVVIGYSPGQARRRTVVVPDADAQVPGLARWLENMGESVLVGDMETYLRDGPDAMLASHTGRPPASDRCAVVSPAGVVVGHVCADPAIDGHVHVGGVPHRLCHDPEGLTVQGQAYSDRGAP